MIITLTESLLERLTAADGRIFRDRLLCGFAVRANKRHRMFLIATSVKGRQVRMKRCNDQRLQKAKAFRDRIRPVLDGMAAQGLSRRAMIVRMNELRIKAPMGCIWSLGQEQRLAYGSFEDSRQSPSV